ncbi:MAG: hypothetical protein ACP5E4_02650, partial [Candidatus Aenigmatarchaeota archaeon]
NITGSQYTTVSFSVPAPQNNTTPGSHTSAINITASESVFSVPLNVELLSPVLETKPSWVSDYLIGDKAFSAAATEAHNTTRRLYLNLNETKSLLFYVKNSGNITLEGVYAYATGFSGLNTTLAWTDGENASEPRNLSTGSYKILNLTVISPDAEGSYTGVIYVNSSNSLPVFDSNITLNIDITNETIVAENSTSGVYYFGSGGQASVAFMIYFYDNETEDTLWGSSHNLSLANSTNHSQVLENLTFTHSAGAFTAGINGSTLSEGNYTVIGSLEDWAGNTADVNFTIELVNNIGAAVSIAQNESLLAKNMNFTFTVTVSKNGSAAPGNVTVCLQLPSGITNMSASLCRQITNLSGDDSDALSWTLKGTLTGAQTINVSAYTADGRFNTSTQKSIAIKYGSVRLEWRYSSDHPGSSVDVNDQFYVKVKVTNNGNLDATDVDVNLIYSGTYFEKIDSDDDDPCEIGTLSVGETDYCTWKLKAKSAASDREIAVSVSADNATVSSSISRYVDIETPSTSTNTGTTSSSENSTSTGSAALTFTKPTASKLSLFQGESYALVVTVKNTGDNELDNLYLEVSGINSSAYTIDSVAKSDLAEDASRTYTIHLKIPTDMAAKDYTMAIKAIATQSSWTKTMTLTVKGILLTFSGLENLSVTQGEDIEVNFSAKNTGGKDLNDLRISIEGAGYNPYNITPTRTVSLGQGLSQNYTLFMQIPENETLGKKGILVKIVTDEKTFTYPFTVNVLPCAEERTEIQERYANLSVLLEDFMERYKKINANEVNLTELDIQINLTQQKMLQIDECLREGDYAEAKNILLDAEADLNSLEISIKSAEKSSGPKQMYLMMVLAFVLFLLGIVAYYVFFPSRGYKPGRGYKMPGTKAPMFSGITRKITSKFSRKSPHEIEREKKLAEWRRIYENAKKKQPYGS